jgi:hypothetical protein
VLTYLNKIKLSNLQYPNICIKINGSGMVANIVSPGDYVWGDFVGRDCPGGGGVWHFFHLVHSDTIGVRDLKEIIATLPTKVGLRKF